MSIFFLGKTILFIIYTALTDIDKHKTGVLRVLVCQYTVL